jgi:UDP-N-acetylmuramyl pentapeptide synthase
MGLDGVFTVGEHTVHTDSAIQNGLVHEHFSSRESLIESLKNIVNSGDRILFKGSRGMAMEKVIEGVFSL